MKYPRCNLSLRYSPIPHYLHVFRNTPTNSLDKSVTGKPLLWVRCKSDCGGELRKPPRYFEPCPYLAADKSLKLGVLPPPPVPYMGLRLIFCYRYCTCTYIHTYMYIYVVIYTCTCIYLCSSVLREAVLCMSVYH